MSAEKNTAANELFSLLELSVGVAANLARMLQSTDEKHTLNRETLISALSLNNAPSPE